MLLVSIKSNTWRVTKPGFLLISYVFHLLYCSMRSLLSNITNLLRTFVKRIKKKIYMIILFLWKNSFSRSREKVSFSPKCPGIFKLMSSANNLGDELAVVNFKLFLSITYIHMRRFIFIWSTFFFWNCTIRRNLKQ